MPDRDPSSSHRRWRSATEEDEGGPVGCTGQSCQSCTVGVVADCVAVLCCPCAVVNIISLAFLKLPWAMARKCIKSRPGKSGCRRMVERTKACSGDEVTVEERVKEGKSGDGSPRSGGGAVVQEELTSTFPGGRGCDGHAGGGGGGDVRGF